MKQPTYQASTDPVLWLNVVAVVIMLASMAWPDTHVGLLLLLVVGVNWLVAVEASASPWSIVAGVGIALTHTSLAASSVSPFGARWTSSMIHRWRYRLIAVGGLCLPTWALVWGLDRRTLRVHPVVVVLAILVLTLITWWLQIVTRETKRTPSS